MKTKHIRCRMTFILSTLCSTGLLVAQAPEKAPAPEARQAPITHPDLVLFPPAEAGMERLVIVLPHKGRDEEGAFRVELLAGKMMETDGVNRYSLGSNLEVKDLKGYGFSYYEIKEGPVAMTLIKPGPGMEKKFVSGESHHMHYNSRLPIVIYAPAGYEVRYRIWKADENYTTATKR